MNEKPAVFVMPHKSDGSRQTEKHFREAIESIENQTDENWVLAITDDCSDNENALTELDNIEKRLGDKVHIVRSDKPLGTGRARNEGIRFANEISSPFILFLDTDDIAHEKRLELTRKAFESDEKINVVYSSFNVIDENSDIYSYDDIPLTIREIIDGHAHNAVQGENAWIDLATKKNYTTLTSCTAVKTSLAVKEPFPALSVSEDTHTWYRYGAHPGKYVFLGDFKNSYRVCKGTGSRSRSANPDFYDQKAANDEQGFEKAVKIYSGFNNVAEEKIEQIRTGFLVRESLCMLRVEQTRIAKDLLKKSVAISPEKTQAAVANLEADNAEKEFLAKIAAENLK